jgi:threonine/homoserine/homoserine lactone efflux protein
MTESIITISIVGFIVGFFFSMPIAGPISILITSNAFHGRAKYCYQVTAGASIADFIYVFVALFGLTKLYSLYKPAIPYILLLGSFFLLFIGYKIFKTKVDIEHLDAKNLLPKKIDKKIKGAFYTGFLINFLNPTIFIGWITSSFIVISFVASMGFNMGGLDSIIDQNVKDINNIEGNIIEKPQIPSYFQFDNSRVLVQEEHQNASTYFPKSFPLIISICYSFFLALGSIVWFYLLVLIISRFLHKININMLNRIVNYLGILLCFIGIFFAYTAIKMFLLLLA